MHDHHAEPQTSAASPPRSTPSAPRPAPAWPGCCTRCSPAASASSCSAPSSTTSSPCWASGDRQATNAARPPPSWRWRIPLLVSLAIGLVWLLGVGAAQVRTVDAARETARALARGDAGPRSGGARRAGRSAGKHASRSARAAARWCRRRPARSDRPGGLLGFLPAVPARRGGRRRRGVPVSRRASERGSATLLAVAMVGLLLLVGAALGVVTAMVRAHRVAQSGGRPRGAGGRRGLAVGRDAVRRRGGRRGQRRRLTACRVDGRDVRRHGSRSPGRTGSARPPTCRPRPAPGRRDSEGRAVRPRPRRRRAGPRARRASRKLLEPLLLLAAGRHERLGPT